MQPALTTRDGQTALRDHVREKALEARTAHTPITMQRFRRLLEDPAVVRYPTTIVFDEGPLEPGEFAYVEMRGDAPRDGFHVFVHPSFRDRDDVLPHLIAYHLVRVNYGEIVTHEEAELYGATLLGMDVDRYYELLCSLADSLPGSPAPGCCS